MKQPCLKKGGESKDYNFKKGGEWGEWGEWEEGGEFSG
jgi:hypothetical protein